MNSFHYCDEHTGLALINGVRHVCDACHLWNLLALKRTGGDPSHVTHSRLYLHVPLHDSASGINGIRIERFCGDRFDHNNDTPVHRAYPGGLQYMTRDGKLRRVPENAYVHISNSTGLVTGWVRMWEYHTTTDAYHVVADEKRFLELMDKVHGWRHTGWRKSLCDGGGGGW